MLDSNPPEVTIVVPISRMAGKLDSLESWLKTCSGLPIEVLLVHDQRDADTQSELCDLIKMTKGVDIKLHVVHYGSPGLTRNLGMQLAKGKWIQFTDSDDVVNVHSVLSVIKKAKMNTEILITKYALSDGSKKQNCEIKFPNPLIDVLLNPGIWRMIFLRDAISNVQFRGMRMGEDQLFLMELQFISLKIEFMDTCTYTYNNDFSGQLTSSPEAISDLLEVIKFEMRLYSKSAGVHQGFYSIMLAKVILTYLTKGKSLGLWSRIRFVLQETKLCSMRHKFNLFLGMLKIIYWKVLK